MKWKNRLTNYNFWVSIVSAVLLILQSFNIQFDISNFNEITTAVLGLLVVIGIINDPTKSATGVIKDEDNKASKKNNSQLESIENRLITEIKNITSGVKEEQINISDKSIENEKVVEQDVKINECEVAHTNIKEEKLEDGSADANLSDKNISEDNLVKQETDLNAGVPINAENENDFNTNKTTDKIFIENTEVVSKIEEPILEENNLTNCDIQNEEKELEKIEPNKIDNSEICKSNLQVEELGQETETNFESANEEQTSFNIVN